MNATSSMSPADRLAEAEAEKVSIEIEQLKRPSYRRVSFWTGIVIPLVALTASIITGELTGFFDDQLESLKNQKTELKDQLEIAGTTAQLLNTNNTRLTKENVVLTQVKEQLEADARQLRDDAQAATKGLETVFKDLNKLVGEKGQLFSLVSETPMDDDQAKQELLNRLSQHLNSIRATGTHLDEVQKVLRKMNAASG